MKQRASDSQPNHTLAITQPVHLHPTSMTPSLWSPSCVLLLSLLLSSPSGGSPPTYPHTCNADSPSPLPLPAYLIFWVLCVNFQEVQKEGSMYTMASLLTSPNSSLGFMFLCLSLVVISESCLVPLSSSIRLLTTKATRVIYGGRSSCESPLPGHGKVLGRRVRRGGGRDDGKTAGPEPRK